MYGTFDMGKRKITIESEEYTYIENNKCIAFHDGHPSEQIEILLEGANFAVDWMKGFIGPFILILFKKDSGELLITQHLFGNGKNLYLCKNNDIIYIASSLRKLKNLVKTPFKLNLPMLPYYFYNGFFPGTHTLIERVQKLEAGVCVVIDSTGIHKRALSFSVQDKDENFASLADEYKDVLSDSVYNMANNITGPVSLALSGGYDSNSILYSIKKRWPDKEVNAFSIGGVNGSDETGTAAQIAKSYDAVDFKSSFVNPGTLEHLDEIVSVLEGSVYERGIFLQYELAKLLKLNSTEILICGECADQVFHKNTYIPIPQNTFLYGYQETPYQMAVYVVLRKSRMMMEAFGVDARYPFLTPEMIHMGYKLRKFNGTTKEFHKAQCRDLFPQTVLDLIAKRGGSTNLGSLFPEGFDCSTKLEESKYYSPDFKLTGKYSHEEAVRDYYLSLLYLESFEKQFCDE